MLKELFLDQKGAVFLYPPSGKRVAFTGVNTINFISATQTEIILADGTRFVTNLPYLINAGKMKNKPARYTDDVVKDLET